MTNHLHTPYFIDLINSGTLTLHDLEIPVPERFVKPEERKHLYVPGSPNATVGIVGKQTLTATERSSLMNCPHWLHRKLSKSKLPVQPMMTKNGKVFTLTNSSPTAPEVVNMTSSGAAGCDKFVNMTTLPISANVVVSRDTWSYM